jgi:hypothetical protein
LIPVGMDEVVPSFRLSFYRTLKGNE